MASIFARLKVVFGSRTRRLREEASKSAEETILPDEARSWKQRGDACLDSGNWREAIVCYEQAIQIDPHYVDALVNISFALLSNNQTDRAAEYLFGSVLTESGSPDALYLRALISRQRGNYLEAIGLLCRAIEVAPQMEPVYAELCRLLASLGNMMEARKIADQGIERFPANVELLFLAGNIHLSLDAPDSAAVLFDRCVAIAPGYKEAWASLAIALRRLGDLERSEDSFRKSLELDSGQSRTAWNYGLLLHDRGKFESSVSVFRKVIAHDPEFAEAHSALAMSLFALGIKKEAVRSLQCAIALNPKYAEALANLGVAYYEEDLIVEAKDCLVRAIELAPTYMPARSQLLFIRNFESQYSPQAALDEAIDFGSSIVQHTGPSAWSNPADPSRCLNIGFVSGDLREHPVGYFMEGVLKSLVVEGGGRMKFFVYQNHPCEDAVTERLRGCCEGWMKVVGMSDDRVADRVREDGIDILVDLSGHTAYNRLPLFALRPAPVQVTWLGYFATTGVKAIDYLVADPWTLPESEEKYFTETIWRLPETRLCFTAPDEAIEVGELPVLKNGAVTFGCFNNLTKMNDAVVALWAEILQEVPGSRLYLKAKQLSEDSLRQRVLERYARHGIGAERLQLEGPSGRRQYLEAYGEIDIALDPFPYTGGTTSAEALWMGVPVLTLQGERFLAKQGVGMLMNVGLPDWVAQDERDYVRLAKRHAEDPGRLAELRRGLRGQALGSPLFDARRFARHFDSALREMWTKWCSQSLI